MKNPIILPMISSILWGITYFIDERLLKVISSQTMMIFSAIASIIVIAICLGNPSQQLSDVKSMTLTQWAMLIVALVAANAANFATFNSIKQSSASYMSVIEITYPLVILLIASIFYHTCPSIKSITGAILIIIGVWIVK